MVLKKAENDLKKTENSRRLGRLGKFSRTKRFRTIECHVKPPPLKQVPV